VGQSGKLRALGDVAKVPLVPKLPLGNAPQEAPASYSPREAIASTQGLPSWNLVTNSLTINAFGGAPASRCLRGRWSALLGCVPTWSVGAIKNRTESSFSDLQTTPHRREQGRNWMTWDPSPSDHRGETPAPHA
jgi:hypothetical protein